MGRRRRVGLRGIFAIAIAVAAAAAACGSVTAIDQSDASGSAGPGAGTANRNAGPEKASGGGSGGAGGATIDVSAALPCAVCALADACCKGAGRGGCGYLAACVPAGTTDEQQLHMAVCQSMVSAGVDGGAPHCKHRMEVR